MPDHSAVLDRPGAGPRAAPVMATPSWLHKPYFLVAAALTLSLGVGWGALLLWQIGRAGSFTAVGVHSINAHGETQIYGWVGLFIMGFATQVFPRMWRSPPISIVAAMLALTLSVAGIVLRAAGLQMHGWSPLALPVAMAGGLLNTAGVVVFGMQILRAYRHRRTETEPAYAFMLVATGWMAISVIFSTVHAYLTLVAPTREALIDVVGTYQAGLRNTQVHGMALTMILGVSIKMLPGMFGVRSVSDRRARFALGMVTLSVIGETAMVVAFGLTRSPLFAAGMYACWIMLALGVGSLLIWWKPCRRLPRDDGRSGKFVRAAYAWLALSLLMLLAMPAWHALAGTHFSHAYFGAARHAITVGFISMMILGIAAKVVPSLNGAARRTLSPLYGPFILVNAGCLLRVGLQAATDFVPPAFSVVGVSSVLELVGIAWWVLDLAPHLLRFRRAEVFEPVTVTVGERPLAVKPAPDEVACCSACAAKAH